jgi:hypothetical protein
VLWGGAGFAELGLCLSLSRLLLGFAPLIDARFWPIVACHERQQLTLVDVFGRNRGSGDSHSGT